MQAGFLFTRFTNIGDGAQRRRYQAVGITAEQTTEDEPGVDWHRLACIPTGLAMRYPSEPTRNEQPGQECTRMTRPKTLLESL